MSAVQTSHMMYVDMDFWVSTELYDLLLTQHVRQQLAHDPKLAVVIPAFQLSPDTNCQPNCTAVYKDRMPSTPSDIQNLQHVTATTRGNKTLPAVGMFEIHTNPTGHNTTNYNAWFRQTPGSLLSIPCFHSGVYEPYVALRYCEQLPPRFPEQFTGYGKNKISWIWHLRRLGYVFQQLGGAFVVHFPHEHSKSKQRWSRLPKGLDDTKENPFHSNKVNITKEVLSLKRVQMDEIFVRFRNWLWTTYPSTEVRTPRCDSWTDNDSKLWSPIPIQEDPW